MKKAVVFLLTAVTIAGTCVTPNVAYATDGGTQTVSETVQEESKTNDSTQQEDTKSETTKAEKPKETPQSQTVENQPFKPNDNLNKVAKYLSAYTEKSEGYRGSYYTKKDVILIGFNRNSKDEGFEVPGYYYAPIVTKDKDAKIISVEYAEFETNEGSSDTIEDDTVSVKRWNNIMDDRTEDKSDYLKDAKYLNTWVKHNLNDLDILESGNYVGLPTLEVGNIAGVVVYEPDGDYVGTINLEDEKTYESMYDSTVTGLDTLSVTLSKPVISEDKTHALIHFDYDFTGKNPAFGEEILLKYNVRDSGGNIVLDGIDLESTIDRTKPSKGTTKDFKVGVDGKYVVEVYTTSTIITKEVTVSGITNNSPEEIVPDLTKPEISYSAKPSGVLDGTPFAITVYSSKPAYITFNGESSNALVKEFTFNVEHNGEYKVTATTEDGAEVEDTLKIDGFVTSLAEIAASAYGSEDSGTLPQTGGIGAIEILILGLISMLAGIGLIKKDELVYFFRKKVSR